jgi:pimeloyl-ACP methyl ester carboxylesterase
MRMDRSERRPGPIPIKNVVLVRGGFVDGSGWEGVFNLLTQRGYNVSVVQNPTISLAADLAATKQILDQQEGDVVLVGHCYGGIVITEAGNHPKVKRLVYITAFAADAGESVSSLIADPPPGRAGASDLAASERLRPPRSGEVRRLFRGRRRACQGRVHGEVAGPLGDRGSGGGSEHAGLENQAQLLSGGR